MSATLLESRHEHRGRSGTDTSRCLAPTGWHLAPADSVPSAPGTATEKDVVKIRDREGQLFELVDGVLVEKVTGLLGIGAVLELAGLLRDFPKSSKLGTLAGEAGMLRLSPGLVRIPDLSFISRARL